MAKINTSTIRCSNSNSNINKVQQHQTAKYVDRVQKKGVEDRQSWTPKVRKKFKRISITRQMYNNNINNGFNNTTTTVLYLEYRIH